MSRTYLDTSSVVPIFVREPNSRRVESWIAASSVVPVISDLVVLEFGATISRLVRETKLNDERAREVRAAFDGWLERILRPLAVTRSMFAAARIIVEDASAGVRGPDALHLALLSATGLPLATFDRKLRVAAETLGLPMIDLPDL